MAEELLQPVDYSALSYDQLSEISRNDHQEDTKQYDKQQNALCLVMIGAICFVCSILFFILSFERKYNKMAGIRPDSLQFIVCVICLVAAITLLSIGLVRFFKAHKIRKHLHQEIIEVTNLKTKMMIEEKESDKGGAK